MSSMTFSTAGEENVRHSSAGRWKGSFNGPLLYGGLREVESAKELQMSQYN